MVDDAPALNPPEAEPPVFVTVKAEVAVSGVPDRVNAPDFCPTDKGEKAIPIVHVAPAQREPEGIPPASAGTKVSPN